MTDEEYRLLAEDILKAFMEKKRQQDQFGAVSRERFITTQTPKVGHEEIDLQASKQQAKSYCASKNSQKSGRSFAGLDPEQEQVRQEVMAALRTKKHGRSRL